MPPRTAVLDLDGTPADSFTVSLQGGTESALITREIWNDLHAAFGDTTTAANVILKLLASSSGGPFKSSGVPLLEELWTRATVLKYLRTEDGGDTVIESTDGVTGTLPFGTNSEIPIRDLAPQEGVRISFRIIAPGGQTADALKLKLRPIANQASSPLSRHVALASGGGIIPADRDETLRALLSGHLITANDSATVVVGAGQLTYEGQISTHLDEDLTFTLADGAAVNLGAGESYRVTVSRDEDDLLVGTRGLEGVLTYPDMPDGNVFVGQLTVASADGVAVTVSQASVIQTAIRYAGMQARAGAGLTLILSPGDAVSSTDLRQYVSHEVPVNLTASSTNYLWLLPDGAPTVTLTDASPQIGANLAWIAVTGVATVASLTDMRVMLHRAQLAEHLHFAPYTDAFSQLVVPAYGLAMIVAEDDCEIERVSMDLTAPDASWTDGAIVGDIIAYPPGAEVPFPAGGLGSGGTSIFDGYDAADLPLQIAFDADSFRVETNMHTTRRILRGTRLLFGIVAKVDAPVPEVEQQIRAAVTVRRYR